MNCSEVSDKLRRWALRRRPSLGTGSHGAANQVAAIHRGKRFCYTAHVFTSWSTVKKNGLLFCSAKVCDSESPARGRAHSFADMGCLARFGKMSNNVSRTREKTNRESKMRYLKWQCTIFFFSAPPAHSRCTNQNKEREKEREVLYLFFQPNPVKIKVHHLCISAKFRVERLSCRTPCLVFEDVLSISHRHSVVVGFSSCSEKVSLFLRTLSGFSFWVFPGFLAFLNVIQTATKVH